MKVIESDNKQSKATSKVTLQKELYLEERRQQILKHIQQQRRVSVVELSQKFNVSAVTIRADLQDLARRKLVVRTHGGAVLPEAGPYSLFELALKMRQKRQVIEKQCIGQAGAAMVADGDAIVLDSSSTALAIAQQLKNHRQVTVITNALAVAQTLFDAPGVTVVMIGGTLQRDTVSLTGLDGLDLLQKFNLQKGFFGAHGLSFREGLTDVSAAEAEVKRPLAAKCRQLIAVLDATKWGRVGLASFAPVTAISTIITDTGAPLNLVNQARSMEIEVKIV